MKMELNYLAEKLFNKNSFRDLNAVELDQLVSMFPYSSLLQFMYTKKLKEKNAYGYADSVARAALYFSNPHWLNHQLNLNDHKEIPVRNPEKPVGIGTEMKTYPKPGISEDVEVEENTGEDGIEITSITDTIISSPIETIPEEEESQPIEEIEESISQEEIKIEFGTNGHDDKMEVSEEIPVEEPLPLQTEEIPSMETLPLETEENIEETVPKDPINFFVEETREKELPEEQKEMILETVENVKQEIEPDSSLEEESSISLVRTEEEEVEPEIISETKIREPVEVDENQIASEAEEKVLASEVEGEKEPEKEENWTKKIFFNQNFETESKEPDDAELIPIEPLYTVDYFASQGIKLSREEEGKDKLGKSLKSFTEWLKSMKDLHPDKRPEKIDERTEQMVRSRAEYSNEEADVITEAMAEVLTRQGLGDKAVEVYQKLSLLIPGKSAYFAAKIQELKARKL